MGKGNFKYNKVDRKKIPHKAEKVYIFQKHPDFTQFYFTIKCHYNALTVSRNIVSVAFNTNPQTIIAT